MTQPLEISVSELALLHERGKGQLFDVRTPIEYREVRAAHSQNLPLERLNPQSVMQLRNGADKYTYVICQSGKRGAEAQQKLLAAGVPNVINVAGGLEAWIEAGLSVIRCKKTISLERQVRIAAGSLVLVSSLASLVSGSVYFAGIAAFIGAGLVFAGITNSCALGTLIAKMPWNRLRDEPCSL